MDLFYYCFAFNYDNYVSYFKFYKGLY